MGIIDDTTPELKEAIKDLKSFDDFVSKDKYVLTVRISIPTARDDIEARLKASTILKDINHSLDFVWSEAKLQQIYQDKEPRKISIDV